MKCPLCLQQDRFSAVEGPDERDFYHCKHCDLIFTGPEHKLSLEEEKARYEEHNNGIEFPGYVNLLNQAIDPALPYLEEGMKGLDFGCGPNPTLSILLERKGIQCDDYDPIFFPRSLSNKYDFIFSTECFEHFNRPDSEIRRLSSLLKPDGLLIVMTVRWESMDQFPTWYYARDPTHVAFYHQRTFEFICSQYGFESLPADPERVIILRKKETQTQ